MEALILAKNPQAFERETYEGYYGVAGHSVLVEVIGRTGHEGKGKIQVALGFFFCWFNLLARCVRIVLQLVELIFFNFPRFTVTDP